ncbi:MAG: tyrosine-type recombinase/integrase [bacterium]
MATIYKRGNLYWYQVRLEGRQYQGSTKTGDKKLAQQIANTIETDLVRKKFSMPVKSNYTFLPAWEQYVNSLNNSNGTIKVKGWISKHFLPVFGNRNIADITQSDIKSYQLKRKIEIAAMPKNIDKRESEISFAYLNKEILILSNFCNFCIERGLIEKNPAAGIKKLNELSRLKTLSESDINKLIAGATNKLTRDLITFLIYTGCRKGEALNLKWEDVDLSNDVIAVKATKTKFDRYIPISQVVKGLLSHIDKKSDYVFCDKNGQKLNDFKKSFHTALKNAGLKDMHIHDLRHVFASKMVMGGTSLYITGELLGHKTPQMTMRYAHLMPDGLKKAMDDVFGKNHFENMQATQFKKAMEIIKEKKK